jgi:hypothetical protein
VVAAVPIEGLVVPGARSVPAYHDALDANGLAEGVELGSNILQPGKSIEADGASCSG